jgi:hypothetical protein
MMRASNNNYELHFFLYRTIFGLILVTAILSLIHEVKVQLVACDNIYNFDWNFGYVASKGILKTCTMQKTSINTTGAIFSGVSDEFILGLRLSENKNIVYLPEKVSHSLPNLLVFEATSCSVKNISNKNFNGLNKLSLLSVSINQIEKIASDTFEGLVALEALFLCEQVMTQSFQINFTHNFILSSSKQNQVHQR